MPYANEEAQREYSHNHYVLNREVYKERARKRRQGEVAPPRVKYDKPWRRRNFASYLWISKRAQAAKKGLPFDLTKEWIEIQLAEGACAVTGIPLREDGESRDPRQPSIDRIDNTKGYTVDNSRIVCLWYNLLRNQYDDAVVRDLILTAARNME